MAIISRKFTGAVTLCVLLVLCCLPARAQTAPAPGARQQPSDVDILAEPAYKRIMMSCMQKAVNPPILRSGQHVDPSLFRIDGEKLEVIKKCMEDKGFPMPSPKQQYSQTGGENRNTVPPPHIAVTQPTYIPPVAPPPAASDEVTAPPPPANNTPPAGANTNNGARHLWVVPQSQ